MKKPAGVNRRALSKLAFNLFPAEARLKQLAQGRGCIPDYTAQELFLEMARVVGPIAHSGENRNATKLAGCSETSKVFGPPDQLLAAAIGADMTCTNLNDATISLT